MGGNEPIREREFDRYVEDADRRLTALERWRESHERSHDEDDDDQTDRRRWSWQQVAAWITVAGLIVGLWLQATHK